MTPARADQCGTIAAVEDFCAARSRRIFRFSAIEENFMALE
jgi:hypothetical protein